MNDGGFLAVEVAQAKSHIMNNRVAYLIWENAILLNTRCEICGKIFND